MIMIVLEPFNVADFAQTNLFFHNDTPFKIRDNTHKTAFSCSETGTVDRLWSQIILFQPEPMTCAKLFKPR